MSVGVANGQSSQQLISIPDANGLDTHHNPLSNITINLGVPDQAVFSISHGQIDNIENDPLIDSYYRNFHTFHPFLLPRKHLIRLDQVSRRQINVKPLIAAMRLVGHIYDAREWSITLKEYTESCISQLPPSEPVQVQCRLLYSIALFWHNFKVEAKREMDTAARLAVEQKMYRKEFAVDHGGDDPVLTECWRRTWWMLFIIDAYYTGTLGTMNFAVFDVEATVELPCEEAQYDSGTMEDFDSREFASEGTSFSSFTYLIGAVRCAALAISSTPKSATKEDSAHVIQSADSVLDGWLLLLPKDDKPVMTTVGEIDELMFQAHMLLALPVRPFHHTPFTTCMLSEAALALLSACNYLLKGKKLAIARDQIRLTIGCLKALGEIWPRTAKNVAEIQTIARHVLGLKAQSFIVSNLANSNGFQSPYGGENQSSTRSEAEASSSGGEGLVSLGSMDDVCGWYNLEDMGSDLAQWIGSVDSNTR
ncbi:hypothetical protein CCHL11_09280 [Colletotrichum chlorophyti]|uniref:Xylanolytic transcriptional activator regulatory domain-containing protein n=1 Tax=Colletotrichum chlorophyti TaxID=708187 RepID=A0A1Q8RSQ8_9PEZI|nr:hypothetical protein CCHL11_09280 [Colletotrichum chlorophyti]